MSSSSPMEAIVFGHLLISEFFKGFQKIFYQLYLVGPALPIGGSYKISSVSQSCSQRQLRLDFELLVVVGWLQLFPGNYSKDLSENWHGVRH